MRHPIAAVLFLATLAGCGSEGPNTPPGATASFSVSARIVPVRCNLTSCPAPSLVSIPVRVTESGGMMGGYVTSMDFVLRDEVTGGAQGSQHYNAAQIASLTLLESNQVFPNAWLEIVAHPFPITDGEGRASTVRVAITVTDYRGNEHRRTLDVSLD